MEQLEASRDLHVEKLLEQCQDPRMGFLGLLLDREAGREGAWSCYQDLGSQKLDRAVKVLRCSRLV